ncbi:hypothetical protein Tco_0903106 [Tanacetum coccineum]
MNFFRSRKVGMIWSFGFLGVCKRTKIPFVCEYGLAIEWNSEDLTELLEGKSDEFVLNHEGDKNDARVIFLKSDLTIKVQNKTRDNWLINFVETIETYVRKTTIDVIRCVVKLINNSTLMNASIFDRSETCVSASVKEIDYAQLGIVNQAELKLQPRVFFSFCTAAYTEVKMLPNLLRT